MNREITLSYNNPEEQKARRKRQASTTVNIQHYFHNSQHKTHNNTSHTTIIRSIILVDIDTHDTRSKLTPHQLASRSIHKRCRPNNPKRGKEPNPPPHPNPEGPPKEPKHSHPQAIFSHATHPPNNLSRA